MPIDISIIIPCYNRIQMLKQTLKSVEAAILHIHAEIILVDDGSTVLISDQLPEFAHLPIVFIRQKNSGLTTSRYNGLLAAKGEYIQFLDSDDQVDARKFEVQLKHMRAHRADVSHTDVVEYRYDLVQQSLTFEKMRLIPHFDEPAVFYIKVQPVPHSPIFNKAYLISNILNAFIPLSRDYDSIGEIWFYYNLSIYPAKIIKIDEPLTIIIHHMNGRLTDHWELLGLCALSLMQNFIANVPQVSLYSNSAKKMVAIVAFSTFRSLPYNMDRDYQYAFINIWKKLGGTKIQDLNGGKYFSILAGVVGLLNAAKMFQRINGKNYSIMKSIDEIELRTKLDKILNEVAHT